MKLVLPDCQMHVKVWVHFDTEERRLHPWDENNTEMGKYRTTVVSLRTDPSGDQPSSVIAFGKSGCSPLDNFCRLTGRKLACQDLFKKMKSMSKRDRKAIFDLVCAQYAIRAEKGRKAKEEKKKRKQSTSTTLEKGG